MRRTIGPLEIRTFGPLAKDERIPGHKHLKDHVTYCAVGAFGICECDESEQPVGPWTELEAGSLLNSHILVPAGVRHLIVSRRDGTGGHCQFAHYDMEDRPSQTYDGNEAVYR